MCWVEVVIKNCNAHPFTCIKEHKAVFSMPTIKNQTLLS